MKKEKKKEEEDEEERRRRRRRRKKERIFMWLVLVKFKSHLSICFFELTPKKLMIVIDPQV